MLVREILSLGPPRASPRYAEDSTGPQRVSHHPGRMPVMLGLRSQAAQTIGASQQRMSVLSRRSSGHLLVP